MGLAAIATGNQINLTWTASNGAASYNIKRTTTPGGPYTTVGNTLTASYTNAGLDNGTAYYYVVSAVNSGGESTDSDETFRHHLTCRPCRINGDARPRAGDFELVRIRRCHGLYRETIDHQRRALHHHRKPGVPNFTDVGLSSSTTYFYVVSAVNAAGESIDSTQVSATPLPATPSTWIGIGTAGSRAPWSTAANWTGTVPANGSTVEGLTFSNTGNSWSNNDLTGLTVNGFTMLGMLPTRDNNIAGNAISLIGDVTVSTGSWQTIGINIALRGSRTFNISSGITLLNGQLSDDTSAGAIIKSGGAELLLAGTNSISAAKRLTLNNGTVTLENPAALGAAVANTTDRSIEFGTGVNTLLQIKTDSPANKHNFGGGSTSATTTISLGRKTAGAGHVQDFGFLDAGSRTITFNQGANVTSGSMTANSPTCA